MICKLLGCRLVKPTAVVAWLPVPRQHGSNINVSNRNPPERAAHVIHFNFPPPKKKVFCFLLLSDHICCGKNRSPRLKTCEQSEANVTPMQPCASISYRSHTTRNRAGHGLKSSHKQLDLYHSNTTNIYKKYIKIHHQSINT